MQHQQAWLGVCGGPRGVAIHKHGGLSRLIQPTASYVLATELTSLTETSSLFWYREDEEEEEWAIKSGAYVGWLRVATASAWGLSFFFLSAVWDVSITVHTTYAAFLSICPLQAHKDIHGAICPTDPFTNLELQNRRSWTIQNSPISWSGSKVMKVTIGWCQRPAVDLNWRCTNSTMGKISANIRRKTCSFFIHSLCQGIYYVVPY